MISCFADDHVVKVTLAEMPRSNAEFADVFVALGNNDPGCIAASVFSAGPASRISQMDLLT